MSGTDTVSAAAAAAAAPTAAVSAAAASDSAPEAAPASVHPVAPFAVGSLQSFPADALIPTMHACRRLLHSNISNEDVSTDGEPWRRVAATQRATVWAAAVPGTSLKRFRARTQLPFPVDVVYPTMTTRRSEWDPALESIDIRRWVVPDEMFVVRFVLKKVLTISSRDFVDALWSRRTEDGGAFSCSCSLIVDELPPVKNAVRAINHPGGGWLMTPTDGGAHTRFECVFYTDIKGWVPHAVLNAAFSKNLVELVERLHEQCPVTAARLAAEASAAAAAPPTTAHAAAPSAAP
jgi:hypothetical protein